MKDVAALSGVSLKTVSRALNGEPGVHAETRTRVTEAATKLGFRRNDLAASLRRLNRSMATIGLLIEDVSNPFYAAVTRGVEEVARDRDHVLLAASSDEDPELERKTLSAFLSRRVDGMIVVPAGADHSFLERDVAVGTAFVFADRPAGGLDTDSVVAANFRGAADGVKHLIEVGHRRIAYVGDSAELYTARERYRGYLRALRAADIAVDKCLVRQGVRDVESAYAAAAELLDGGSPPTAFFSANNRCTVGIVRCLRGRRPRVALVGFDDFELADALDPPVTVVRTDAYGLGRAAAKRLFLRLDGDASNTRRIVIPAVVVPRGSGEIRPGRRR